MLYIGTGMVNISVFNVLKDFFSLEKRQILFENIL